MDQRQTPVKTVEIRGFEMPGVPKKPTLVEFMNNAKKIRKKVIPLSKAQFYNTEPDLNFSDKTPKKDDMSNTYHAGVIRKIENNFQVSITHMPSACVSSVAQSTDQSLFEMVNTE